MNMYADILSRLYDLQKESATGKYSMDKPLALQKHLNFPDAKTPMIHVAGTNGKGSVVTKISKTLQLAGYKVGKFMQPHISTFRERIQINGIPISEEDIEEYLPPFWDEIASCGITFSFFELSTFFAFAYFAHEAVDVAVIETGLGGRLDCTNVIHPILTVITSISLDHVHILGDTREAISAEKAGIIKPHIPVVLSPRACLEPVYAKAKEQEAPVIALMDIYDDFDSENTAIAKQACTILQKTFHIDSKAIDEGCLSLPPCRFELVSSEQLKSSSIVILDVAHNPDGFRALFEKLRKTYPNNRVHAVAAFSGHKDVRSCWEELKKGADCVDIVTYPHSRLLLEEELRSEFQKWGESFPWKETRLEKVVPSVLLKASQENEIVVFCGSFFIMAPLREILGFEEDRDPYELNEHRLPASEEIAVLVPCQN